ncbi:MAG: hypothetical protein AAF193_09175 [Bacteroidota bacterium]
MELKIKHATWILASTVCVCSLISCGEKAPESVGGIKNSPAPEHQNAPVVSTQELTQTQEKVETINKGETQVRRLVLDGLKGSAEVSYDGNKELVKIKAMFSTDNGNEVNQYFFENGVLIHSEHHQYFEKYSSTIGNYVIDQKFYYTPEQKIKGSYSRFGDVNGDVQLNAEYEPFDVEVDVIEAMKLDQLRKIRESLRV